jgi:hypothetical protein
MIKCIPIDLIFDSKIDYNISFNEFLNRIIDEINKIDFEKYDILSIPDALVIKNAFFDWKERFENFSTNTFQIKIIVSEKKIISEQKSDDITMQTMVKILAERNHQFSLGFTIEKDSIHNKFSQLLDAAIGLLQTFPKESDLPTNWDRTFWLKMIDKDYEERILIATSLLVAEMDRMAYEKNTITFKK